MKIFDNRYKSGQIDVTAEISDSFSTFGGEFSDGESHFANYGLDLGEISISDISPAQYKSLAVDIINHLLVNGYRFEILDNRQGNGEYLREIK